jgi:hypothetical protein
MDVDIVKSSAMITDTHTMSLHSVISDIAEITLPTRCTRHIHFHTTFPYQGLNTPRDGHP